VDGSAAQTGDPVVSVQAADYPPQGTTVPGGTGKDGVEAWLLGSALLGGMFVACMRSSGSHLDRLVWGGKGERAAPL
jgi:hypothetical protein